MPVSDYYMKVGDTASPIYSTLEDANGDPVDIQNAAVQFKLAPIAGGTVTVDDAAVNLQVDNGSDGSKGDVRYNWGTAPSDAGLYLGEWQVTFGGGLVQTFPNDGYILVNVAEDL